MFELFALVTFWGLYALALWILSRRGPLSRWTKVALAGACLAVSGALYWVLFDIPGLLRMQRLMAAGEYEAAVEAHQPLFQPDGRVMLAVFSALLLFLGLHLAVRPHYWLKAASPKGSAPVEPSRAALVRFRVYGVLISLGGLVAAAATVWWLAA